tara:strand:+ start:13 stop:249 length:237 start_codon:yes stop_codon:yes gene_type:complete
LQNHKENKKARNVKQRIKHKQTQSQNVNQIARIYLDERKKECEKVKTKSIKTNRKAPVFQNPSNDIFPLQLPMVHKML